MSPNLNLPSKASFLLGLLIGATLLALRRGDTEVAGWGKLQTQGVMTADTTATGTKQAPVVPHSSRTKSPAPSGLLSQARESLKRIKMLRAVGQSKWTSLNSTLSEPIVAARSGEAPSSLRPRVCLFLTATRSTVPLLRTALWTWARAFPDVIVWSEDGALPGGAEQDDRPPGNPGDPAALPFLAWMTADTPSWSAAMRRSLRRSSTASQDRSSSVLLQLFLRQRFDELFPGCDWVLRASSSSYINYQSTVDQLRRFNASRPYYYGTFAEASRATSCPNIAASRRRAKYAMVGTGFAVSRGLLNTLPLERCVEYYESTCSSWLRFEDSMLGHCSQHWFPATADTESRRTIRLNQTVSVAGESVQDVRALLAGKSEGRRECLKCAAGIYPLGALEMRQLHTMLQPQEGASGSEEDRPLDPSRCERCQETQLRPRPRSPQLLPETPADADMRETRRDAEIRRRRPVQPGNRGAWQEGTAPASPISDGREEEIDPDPRWTGTELPRRPIRRGGGRTDVEGDADAEPARPVTLRERRERPLRGGTTGWGTVRRPLIRRGPNPAIDREDGPEGRGRPEYGDVERPRQGTRNDDDERREVERENRPLFRDAPATDQEDGGDRRWRRADSVPLRGRGGRAAPQREDEDGDGRYQRRNRSPPITQREWTADREG